MIVVQDYKVKVTDKKKGLTAILEKAMGAAESYEFGLCGTPMACLEDSLLQEFYCKKPETATTAATKTYPTTSNLAKRNNNFFTPPC